MTTWAAKKAVVALDWGIAWKEIAQCTEGVQSPEVLALVLALDDRYHAGDKAGFVALKADLERQLLPAGSSNTSTGSSGAMPAKSLEVCSPADGRTLSGATQGGLF